MRLLFVAVCVLIAVLASCSDDALEPGHDTLPDAHLPDAHTDDIGPWADVLPAPDAGPREPWEPGPGRGAVIGRSVEGRPIVAEWYGSGGPILYILAAIHGSERSAVTAGERLRRRLQAGLAEQHGIQIFFVGAANPDGIAYWTRHNARDIDLNRNFPAANFTGGAGGVVPLSEPESEAIHATIEALEPTAVISLHCCGPMMDWDGPAGELADRMSDASGFPPTRLGSAPGSLGSWTGVDLGIPTITVEYAPHERQATHGQLDRVEAAIVAAAAWTRDNGAETIRPIDDLLPFEAANDYLAFDYGRSAAGRALRAEALGPYDPDADDDTTNDDTLAPVLVISGADSNDRRAIYLAEHLRRVLHSELYAAGIPTLLVTAANPDGLLRESVRNGDGLNLARDFAAQRSPEVRALTDFIEARGVRYVIVVEPSHGTNRIELAGFANRTIAPLVESGLRTGARSEAADPYDPASFAGWLRARDIPLIVLQVRTMYAMGDTRNGARFDDIGVFSRSVLAILEADL